MELIVCTSSFAEKAICPWNEMVINDMTDGGQTQPKGTRQCTNSPWFMLYTLTEPSCEPETARSSSVAMATHMTGKSWPSSVWNGLGFVLFAFDTSHTTEVQSLEPLIMYHPQVSKATQVTMSEKKNSVCKKTANDLTDLKLPNFQRYNPFWTFFFILATHHYNIFLFTREKIIYINNKLFNFNKSMTKINLQWYCT